MNRLTNLADELGRAFVETDQRALPIRLVSIEVEDIFDARDELAVDLRDAPHVLAPGLALVFRQATAHGLATAVVVLSEPDQFAGQGDSKLAQRRSFHAMKLNALCHGNRQRAAYRVAQPGMCNRVFGFEVS